ncbi:MAG: glycosyl hydrolase [Bryobacteraceae bacterium]
MRAMLLALMAAVALAAASPDPLGWPAETSVSRPWSYWWWPASAVDEANITSQLERYRRTGWGGVHIIPIYGVRGYESRYIDYLSPRWMAMLRHTVTEARRLGMGVDMTTGTGWCFGGPNIPPEWAAGVAEPSRGEPYTVTFRPRTRVKRPAPGGEGYMLNPFHGPAIRGYLERFTKAFEGYVGPRPRAQYHDSFEYGANWAPDLPEQFARRRGYRLEPHYDALFGDAAGDRAARVKCDYRETLSDALLDNFTRPWVEWSHRQGFVTRDQAHGSPGNLLDLYAANDIPETEMFNRDRSSLVSMFASSAAHVAGRKLVASETGTWLKEHFNETLADLKELVDQLFLAGVNHVLYHGTCYSPDDAPWPGWLFYASTEMNPRNAIWRHVPALNAYISRAQAMLQEGRPANDLLVYWPVYDVWHNPKGLAMNFTVHTRNWVEGTAFGNLAARLLARGYTMDFISDRQLLDREVAGRYGAVVVPACDHMPVATLERLAALARGGTPVVFQDRLPSDVPGWHDLENRRAAFRKALAGLRAGDVEAELARAGIAREPMVDRGLQFIRRADARGRYYFIVNRGKQAVAGWVPLASAGGSAALLDPMTGRAGMAAWRNGEAYLQLAPGESIFVRVFAAGARGPRWQYWQPAGEAAPVAGEWDVRFVDGGPDLPPPFKTAKLGSWTGLAGEAGERFAGAASYSLAFDAPGQAAAWELDLGAVKESARVTLNGLDLGTLIAPPFRVIAGRLKPTGNRLEVEVVNVSANRIRDLDRRKVEWKIFRDINIVNLDYKPLDASGWPVREAGLLGPVRIRPLRRHRSL